LAPSISNGVWPTMVTPFTDDSRLDLVALENQIEWYLASGVAGLFAVCQSSEMFYLTLAERVTLAKAVVDLVDGRVEVIASGHVSDGPADQVEEVRRIADTGVDAVVLVTNRFAQEGDSDDVWIANLERFLEELPDSIRLGFYECPYPYKRLLNPHVMAWCAATGRFVFLKDTSCDTTQMREKLAASGEIKLYNANAATLLESLQIGGSGYSGVMGNFHPQLYVWLCRHWRQQPDRAERLQTFLGVGSAIESRAYPVSAKYALQLEGIPLTLHTRTRPSSDLIYAFRREVEQLRALTVEYEALYAH
jgi:4-hydroxy-tetrahydrodipicolinate synthase